MSKEEYDKILAKIKKCFALGTSPNESESAAAILKARTLMMKYNIEQSELAASQVEDIEVLDIPMSARFGVSASSLAFNLGNAFMVKPILVKTKTNGKISTNMRFIGGITDIATVSYIYGYILNLADEKSKNYFEEKIRYTQDRWTPSTAKKVKSDYSYGFVSAINTKLKAIEAEHAKVNPYEAEVSNALVIVKSARIDKFVEETQGKLKTKTSKTSFSRTHFGEGHAAGEKTGIHRGVAGGSDQLQLER